MAKIVIFGGSGMIGQRAVREALGRGHEVTAVVRDPSKLTDPHPNLTVAAGDVTDPGTVARLGSGADVVINAISPPRVPGADPAAALIAAADSLIAGLRGLGEGAPRLLVVGGAGSLLVAPGLRLVDAPGFPDAYKAEALAHADALAVYRGVEDLEWSYLSPPATISPGERTDAFRLGGDELVADAEGNSHISAEDYAIALIDEAENPKHLRQRFTLAY
jgi:putative NADH-flavin reductase